MTSSTIFEKVHQLKINIERKEMTYFPILVMFEEVLHKGDITVYIDKLKNSHYGD